MGGVTTVFFTGFFASAKLLLVIKECIEWSQTNYQQQLVGDNDSYHMRYIVLTSPCKIGFLLISPRPDSQTINLSEYFFN